MAKDSLEDLVDPTEAYSQVGYGDYDAARNILCDHVRDKLSDLGIDASSSECRSIIESADIESELDDYYISRDSQYDGDGRASTGMLIDQLDDLFSRD